MKLTIKLLPLLFCLFAVSCQENDNPQQPDTFPEHQDYRIYAVDNSGWDALYLYMYGTVNNLGGAWPGIKSAGTVTVKDKTYKYYDVKVSDAYGCSEKLIFNNGSGSQIKDEPSLSFGEKADYFFTVTATGAKAFDGGSTYTIEVPSEVTEATVYEVAQISPGERSKPQIYQVNPKLYGSSGAFNKIAARLDDIKALGTDILYLMPVYEQGKKNAIGSPYCIKDYNAVNSSYGTLAELKSLIDAAHAKGMKVMFDWVANHTSWDHAWITEHPDWYAQDSSGKILYPTADGTWTDVALLDYNSKDLCQAMTAAMLFWVASFDIDGYRCDYAHGPTGSKTGPMDQFWKEAIKVLREVKPGLIMLAESDYSKMYDDGFDHIFSRASKSRLINAFGANGGILSFTNAVKTALGNAPSPCSPLLFVTNHDDATESTPQQDFRSTEGALAAFLLMRSLPVATMMYGSQEIGYSSTINFFNTLNLDWNSNADCMNSYKQGLSDVAKLGRSGNVTIYSGAKGVVVEYEDGGAFAVNLGGSELTLTLPSSLASAPIKLAPYGYSLIKVQ